MTTTPKRFPNESEAYRKARDELLAAEIDLRAHTERVAALRRTLPPGGAAKENYVFEELAGGTARQTRLADLFDGKTSLFLYSFMYGPKAKAPCPMCTSFLDGLDAQAIHITRRTAIAVVAESPIARVAEFAAGRGWKNLRLLSAAGTTYQADYFGEDAGKDQSPMANVFTKDGGTVRHFWGSEVLYAPCEGDTRHIDMLWPLWNVLDLTPEGRGTDFYPKISYG